MKAKLRASDIGATILAIGGTTAAAVQAGGFPRVAGAMMLATNLVVIGIGVGRWARATQEST